MLKFSVVTILIFSCTFNLFAAPNVTDISGDISDGLQVTISGSGFGTNPLNKIEWLGGTGGNIEQGIVGNKFQKTGWLGEPTNPAAFEAKYSDLKSHSGAHSIMSSYTETQYRSDITYGSGTEIKEIYVTWWAYFDAGSFDGQWKMWRMMPVHGFSDNFTPNIYSAKLTNVLFHMRPTPTLDTLWRWSDAPDWLRPAGRALTAYPGKDQWARMEIYIKASSTPGQTDGSLVTTCIRPGTGMGDGIDYDGNLMTYSADQTNRYKYFVFQNYLSGAGRSNVKIFLDDIFVQEDSRARVEIGNDSVWQNCTHREIQIPLTWSDTVTTFTVNQGSFSVGDNLYLFVVDSGGNVSNGFPITMGESVADITAPVLPPMGLKIN